MPLVMQIWSWVIPLLEPIVICLLAWSVYRQRTVKQAKWFVLYCWVNAAQAIASQVSEWFDPDLPYYLGQALEPVSLGLALAAIYEVFQRTLVQKKQDRDWFLRMNAGYLLLASVLALGVNDSNPWKLLRVIHALTMAARILELALLAHFLVLVCVFGYYVRRLQLTVVLGLGAYATASLAGTYILTIYGYSHFSSMVLLQIIAFVFTSSVWMFAIWTQPGESARLATAAPKSTDGMSPAMRELQEIDSKRENP